MRSNDWSFSEVIVYVLCLVVKWAVLAFSLFMKRGASSSKVGGMIWSMSCRCFHELNSKCASNCNLLVVVASGLECWCGVSETKIVKYWVVSNDLRICF